MAFSNMKWSIPYNPWVYFWVFLLFNTLLAFPMPLLFQLEIGLAGIAMPMVLAFLSIKPDLSTGPLDRNFKPGIALSKAGWALVFAAVLAVRLFAAFRERWPGLDDAINAYYSLRLAQNWQWQFFISPCQIPPVFHWLQALFFRTFEPSLSSIYIVPLLFSLLTVVAVFFSARTFFSPFFSALCFLLVAFGFWPLYTGQFCMGICVFLFLEILILGFLGRLAKARSGSQSHGTAVLTGLLTGLGFFVGVQWVIVAALVSATVLVLFKSNRKILSAFLVPFLALFGIFAVVSVWQGNGLYIRHLWAFREGMFWMEQLKDSLSNITALFWNTRLKSYGPAWGGMMNPLWGSLFFIGALECWRMRNRPFVRWLLAGLAVFLVPGFISKDTEIFRILQVLPLLVIVVGLGVQTLLIKAGSARALLLLFVFMACSTALDLRHVTIAYQNNSPEKIPFSNAYQVIREKAGQAGRGALLFDLRANTWDRTLSVATFPFDATRQRDFSLDETKWAALLVNVHYKPFLEDLHSGIQWHDLGKDILWNEGGLTLGIVPVDSRSKSFLAAWIRMNLFFRSLTGQTMDYYSSDCLEPILTEFDRAGGLTGGDRFLESCLSEKKLFSKLVCKSPEDALEITREALARGLPLPTFQTAEGLLLCRFGEWDEARRAFRKALQARLNLTAAREYLSALEDAQGKKK